MGVSLLRETNESQQEPRQDYNEDFGKVAMSYRDNKIADHEAGEALMHGHNEASNVWQ